MYFVYQNSGIGLINSPTTSNWLFEIPPESTSPSKLGVPLPPIAVFSKDTIDWKAVEKIFIKRPKLAKSLIGHGDTGFSTVAFLASLNAAILCKAHCVFEYESHSYFATDGQRLLTKCSLNFNPPDESPLNTWLARGVALLQILPILEEKQLLDDLLSLISPKWVSETEQEKPVHDVQSTQTQPIMPIAPTETKSIPDASLKPKEEPPVEPNSKLTKKPKVLTPNHVATREVFNYAAKYLHVPEYTLTYQKVSKKELSNNPATSKKPTTPKTSFTVTISLPEHSIYATATSFDLPLTEATACAEFKMETEKHHIANNIPSHSLEGPILLTTANVRNFMDFYNDYNDKVVIRIDRKGDLFKSQAFIRNSNTAALETLGPILERSSSRDLETLTLLVAAVTIVKQKPQLLLDYLRSLDGRIGKYVGKALSMELELHQSSLSLMQRTVETTTKLNSSTLRTDEFMDHGIILQQLIHHPDAILDNTSHLIIDEVHERDLDIDFLLTMVKKLVKERIETGKPTPKVCLMSATADAEMLQEYFAFKDGIREITCPVLHVEGRAFPVEKYYLENILDTFRETYPTGHPIWDLLDSNKNKVYLKSEERVKKTDLIMNIENEQPKSVIKWDSHEDDPDSLQNQIVMDTLEGQLPIDLAAIMIAHIASTTENGAILVFLPGIRGINIIENNLKAQCVFDTNFNDENKFKILKLHSSTADKHQEAFKPVSPGCRKIILATNVAETSITIDDIQYVVDTGKHKEENFHQMLRIWSLPSKWISKSSVKQRSGRAGRVQNGSYYGLFSKRRYDSLRKTPRSGMSRVDLQSTCLAVKILGYNESIQDFLASAPEPPSPKAIQSSIEDLQTLGALTSTEKINPLGRLIGILPLRPPLGKIVILGILFRCLDSMIILAALDNIILQVRPLEMEDESDAAMRGFARTSKSDHVAVLNAFRALRHLEEVDGREVMTSFAYQKFLSVASYDIVKRNITLIQQALRRNISVLNQETQGVAELGQKFGGEILNENSDQDELIRALLVQGLYPHIGAWNNYETKYQIVANEKVFVDVEVDKWLRFNVRSIDKLRGAEGVAGQTLIHFNKALRQLENYFFHKLANGEYVVDDKLSRDFAKALKGMLITEQDINRVVEEDELDLAMDLRKFWNRSKSPLDEIPPKETKESVPKFSLLEELEHDEDSYGSFLELVESALEGPVTTKL
ncbi:helicase associated domain-containing protein [Botrytis cinerea]